MEDQPVYVRDVEITQSEAQVLLRDSYKTLAVSGRMSMEELMGATKLIKLFEQTLEIINEPHT